MLHGDAIPFAYSSCVRACVRAGLVKFTDETGRLWTSLADYFIRMGHFEKVVDRVPCACSSRALLWRPAQARWRAELSDAQL